MKHLKKVIIGLLILGVIGAGVFYALNQNKPSVVKVYSVDMVGITEDWSQYQYYSGSVIADDLQPVYVSSTQNVTEILVTENQEVKKGDILLTYDSTLSELSLIRKGIEIQKLDLALVDANKELQVINTYQPGVPIYLSKMPSSVTMYMTNAEVPEEPVINFIFINLDATEHDLRLIDPSTNEEFGSKDEDYQFEFEKMESDSGYKVKLTFTDEFKPEEYWIRQFVEEKMIDDEGTYLINGQEVTVTYIDALKNTVITNTLLQEEKPEDNKPRLLSGTGTKEDPFIFLYNTDMNIDSAFMDELLLDSESVFANFRIYLDDDKDSEVLQTLLMEFYKDGDTQTNKFKVLDVLIGSEEEPDPEEPGNGEEPPYIPPSMTLTAAEIYKLRTEKEAEIRDLTLGKRNAEFEYQTLENEVNNNYVLAQLDGVVGEVIDVETAIAENRQLFQVSSSGSFIVQSTIGELDLQNFEIGDRMSVFSYESGASVEGEIISISPYPTSTGDFWGGGPTSQSSYPMKIKVDKSADLNTGMWVELQPIVSDGNENGFLALMSAFVRTDDGASYVWIEENGVLVKREISVGRIIDGWYTQILNEDIDPSTRFAFPYGKHLKEGIQVEEGTYDDLYSLYGG